MNRNDLPLYLLTAAFLLSFCAAVLVGKSQSMATYRAQQMAGQQVTTP